MKDLTPQQESERLYYAFYLTITTFTFRAKECAKFTAQQIADNTTGSTKIFYQEVIKEIEKL